MDWTTALERGFSFNAQSNDCVQSMDDPNVCGIRPVPNCKRCLKRLDIPGAVIQREFYCGECISELTGTNE